MAHILPRDTTATAVFAQCAAVLAAAGRATAGCTGSVRLDTTVKRRGMSV